MATTNQIKFYKVQTLPATLVVGAVYFEVTTQRICVAKTTTEYDAFGVGLKGAALANGVLTITRFDNTTVTVDLNDIASATSVQTALNAINDKISVINGTGEGSIKKAVADEAALREAADSKIREDFAAADSAAAQDAASEYAAIRGEFAAADAALQTNIDKKADAATTYSKTEVDGLVNVKANAADVYTKTETDSAIKVVSDALAQEVTDRGAAVQGLQDQIDDLEAAAVTVKAADNDKYVAVSKATDSNAYIVSSKGIDDAISTAVSAEKSEREAADADLQDAIDAEKGRIDTLIGDVEGDDALSARQIVQDEVAKQLTSENISDSFDTLKEMAEWISAHPADVQEMNNAISKNATDIANETAARDAADKAHAAAIDALEKADAAQDELIAKKADQTALDETNGKVSALEGLVGTTSVDDQIDAKIDALKLDDTYVNEADYTNDQTAVSNRIGAVEGKVTTLEGKMTTAEGDIDKLETAVANLQTGTGLGEKAAPEYNNSNYLGSAATMVAADMALDAKIKEVADSVTNKNVSAEGDTYVTASASNNKVTVAAVTGTVESKSGLATNQGVYDALCWVEFE